MRRDAHVLIVGQTASKVTKSLAQRCDQRGRRGQLSGLLGTRIVTRAALVKVEMAKTSSLHRDGQNVQPPRPSGR
eukprot:2461792-Prymnesium_polylepis.1